MKWELSDSCKYNREVIVKLLISLSAVLRIKSCSQAWMLITLSSRNIQRRRQWDLPTIQCNVSPKTFKPSFRVWNAEQKETSTPWEELKPKSGRLLTAERLAKRLLAIHTNTWLNLQFCFASPAISKIDRALCSSFDNANSLSLLMVLGEIDLHWQ